MSKRRSINHSPDGDGNLKHAGVQRTGCEPSGDATQADDLNAENLVAPNQGFGFAQTNNLFQNRDR